MHRALLLFVACLVAGYTAPLAASEYTLLATPNTVAWGRSPSRRPNPAMCWRVDMNITQLVDGNVGVHAMCPKKIFHNPVR